MQPRFAHSGGGAPGWFIDNVRLNVAQLRFTSIARAGNDIRLDWTAIGGTTNVVQCGDSASGTFTNLSPPLPVPGPAATAMQYTHTGAATNKTTRFYIIRQLP